MANYNDASRIYNDGGHYNNSGGGGVPSGLAGRVAPTAQFGVVTPTEKGGDA